MNDTTFNYSDSAGIYTRAPNTNIHLFRLTHTKIYSVVMPEYPELIFS